jgi:UDP-N-acetylmuramoyl-tripeptide--D-alanyl-D-alanine ligase
VIGITGSNGKTTTKDMVASVLSTVYKVHKSQGNYNTHEGLPLTVLQAEEDVDWLVLEMGMRGRGEIELLTRIARPDVAIITSIGEAHMERLGSKLEIARAKTEILLGLKDGGLFIRPGDEPLLNETTREIELPRGMTTVRFGLGLTGNNDLIAEQVELVTGGTAFRIKDEEGDYFVPLLGRHNVTNALAAIAAGRYAGVEQPDIVRGLKELVMTGMRIEVVRSSSGATMLNDAFNASPSSMRAGLELLSELTGYSGKIAVLGDMLELGPEEAELHRQIGAMLDPNVIGHVFVYGRLAKYIAEEAVKRYPQGRVLAFEDKQELIRVLSETLGPQDVVLVKGSRGMQLEQVIEGLLALEGL